MWLRETKPDKVVVLGLDNLLILVGAQHAGRVTAVSTQGPMLALRKVPARWECHAIPPTQTAKQTRCDCVTQF